MSRTAWRVAVGFVVAIVAGVARAEEKPPVIKLERVVKGLQHLTYLTSDGTNRLFVVEQEGTIRLMVDGKVREGAYLDIADHVQYGGECGLLSVAFHPKFQENGLLYVNYTTKKPKLKTVISEFHVEPSGERVDAKTERVILTIDQPFSNHNGGQLQFGPDGMLYVGMGDGGKHDDPYDAGQNLGNLLGKILRIDVTPREGYGIPKDNPFVDKAGARPEVWAWGLRNPWRFSFDRKTGEMYAGDVGQNMWEEVDVIVKGGNYGWRAREGLHANPNIPPQVPKAEAIDPIAEYPHKPARKHAVYGKDVADLSISGGYVYRGTRYPALVGWYLYGDYASGRIWGVKAEGGRVTVPATLLLESRAQITSFGEDKDGELYVLDYNGGVYRLVAE